MTSLAKVAPAPVLPSPDIPMQAWEEKSCPVCLESGKPLIETPHKRNAQATLLHKHCLPCIDQLMKETPPKCSLCRDVIAMPLPQQLGLATAERDYNLEKLLREDREDIEKLETLLSQFPISNGQRSHALFLAAQKAHLKSLSVLLKGGSFPNPDFLKVVLDIAEEKPQDQYKEVASLLRKKLAAETSPQRAIEILEILKMDLKKPDGSKIKKITEILNQGPLLQRDRLEATIAAAYCGQLDCVKLLLDHTAYETDLSEEQLSALANSYNKGTSLQSYDLFYHANSNLCCSFSVECEQQFECLQLVENFLDFLTRNHHFPPPAPNAYDWEMIFRSRGTSKQVVLKLT